MISEFGTQKTLHFDMHGIGRSIQHAANDHISVIRIFFNLFNIMRFDLNTTENE